MVGDTTVRTMEYPRHGAPSVPVPDLESPADLVARVRELETQKDDRDRQLARQLEAARRQGFEEGRRAAEGEQTARLRACSDSLTRAVNELHAGREAYLARVEHEVVRLALAIAGRVLHRETQMDPLLLAGAVRVALGQLADSTQVRLRVPAARADLWAEMVRLMPGLPLHPELVLDPEMQDGEAVLESALGAVDLGVKAQLEEIERGFFDLLDARGDNGTRTPRSENGPKPARSEAGKQG